MKKQLKKMLGKKYKLNSTIINSILNFRKDDDIFFVDVEGSFYGSIRYINFKRGFIALKNVVNIGTLEYGYCAHLLGKDSMVVAIKDISEIESTSSYNKKELDNIFFSGSNFRELRRKFLSEYLNISKQNLLCKGYNVNFQGGLAADSLEIFKFILNFNEKRAFIVLHQTEKEKLIEMLNTGGCFIAQFKDWNSQEHIKVRKFIEPDWNSQVKQEGFYIYKYNNKN